MNELSKSKFGECNQIQLDQFLNSDQYRLERSDLIEHLDSCDDCREYLDQQAAAPELWEKLEAHLQPTEYDMPGSEDFSAATWGQFHKSPVEIQDVLDKLAPTDDPNHLGRLGNYEVTGVVGVGGMGVVLKAIDPTLDRIVAIKVMAPQLAGNEKARKRFSREAKAAAAVIHPNVIPIHSVSSTGSLPYLVMAYIRGGSLQKRLDMEGPLTTIEVLRVGSQIAAGLAAAHEQGIVHRDIKPENILMEEGIERITITDFGLARAVDDNTVTQMGTIAGTPMYMSPEQASGEQLDQKSDLFSLGSVLYTMCTGKPPFRADTSFGAMRMIIDEEPQPVTEVNSEVPHWLANCVSKLMAKDKVQRFESAEELHKLLEQCLSHMQQADQPTELEQMEFLRRVAWPPAEKMDRSTQVNRGPRVRRMAGFVVGAVLVMAASIFALMKYSSTNETKTAHRELRTYLQSGISDEYSGNLVRVLLPSPSGRDCLKQLDRNFEQLAFSDGNLSHGIKAIVALLADDRMEPRKPELSFMTWGNGFSGGSNVAFPDQISVSSVRFVTSAFYNSHAELEFTTSMQPNHRNELRDFFKLTPGKAYRVEVPLADLIDNRVDWIDVWKAAIRLAESSKQETSEHVHHKRFDDDKGQSKVRSKVESKTDEVLGHGYNRQGEFIYFGGLRIDEAGKESLKLFAQTVGQELSLCHDVDAASFKALSEEYAKDSNKVYYKWISPGRFWVVELPEADVDSFEVLGFNLARDNQSVWWYGKKLSEVDTASVALVKEGFVWKDANSVWYQLKKIQDADPKTFRHLDQAFYADKNRVYWSNSILQGADPDTFRTFGDDSPYGADQKQVWKANTKVTGVDAKSFQHLHQSIYKDKNGVYLNGQTIKGADPKTLGKMAELDQELTALLADAKTRYIYLPLYGDLFGLELADDSLRVTRPGQPIPFAELNESGWTIHKVTPRVSKRETHVLDTYLTQFQKARQILRTRAEDEKPLLKPNRRNDKAK